MIEPGDPCECGHPAEDHHRWTMMGGPGPSDWVYDECEFYGFNESGGMMPAPGEDPRDPRAWIDHCYHFRPAGGG